MKVTFIAAVTKFFSDLFASIFNNAMKSTGETHEVEEKNIGIDDGRTATDIANEYRMHDRDQEGD